MLDQQKLLTHDRATSGSTPRSCSLKVGDADAGGDRQGRADASGASNAVRARRPAARASRTRRSASACRSTSRARASPRASRPQGGVVSHMRTDVEITCLPKDLPEFLELDLSGMNLNETKFLADVPVPAGVTIPELAHRNAAVVSIHAPRAEEPEPVAAEAAAAPAEGAAAAAAGARRVPPPAAAAPLPAREAQEGRGRRRTLPPRRKAARSSRRTSCDAGARRPHRRCRVRPVACLRCESTTCQASRSS